ncbi:MAG: histidine phosphatase family protein [Oribacterium sp.]|nr:histidine phosphatase family protein [Oribacterium sp.]
MKLILLRHGMTKGNQEHRYVGTTDESILPSEKERLRTAPGKCNVNICEEKQDPGEGDESCESDLRYESQDKVDKALELSRSIDGSSGNGMCSIYISPMRRCMETAESFFPEMISQGRYKIIHDFREMDFGAFEYKTYQEINEDPNPEYRAAYQRYIDSNGETAFPGGESKAEFTERVVRGFNSIAGDFLLSKRKSSTLIFVVHGGTIMALLDRFSEPHKDYFEWSLKPGEGYETDIIVNQQGDLKIINIKKIG